MLLLRPCPAVTLSIIDYQTQCAVLHLDYRLSRANEPETDDGNMPMLGGSAGSMLGLLSSNKIDAHS